MNKQFKSDKKESLRSLISNNETIKNSLIKIRQENENIKNLVNDGDRPTSKGSLYGLKINRRAKNLSNQDLNKRILLNSESEKNVSKIDRSESKLLPQLEKHL